MIAAARHRGPRALAVFVATAALLAAGTAFAEWSQFAHDAQRTAFTTDSVPTPWRWKWAWNGPNAQGGRSGGKRGLPRNSQVVTGDDRVFVAVGKKGVVALEQADGSVAWRRRVAGGSFSTPAWDAATLTVFAPGGKGNFVAIDSSTGEVRATWKSPTKLKTRLPLPPAVVGDRVVAPFGNLLVAFDTTNLAPVWQYDAGSPIDTPAAWSPSRGVFVVVDRDLNVHAVDGADGTLAWKTRPTTRVGGDPGGTDTSVAEASYGWPVIAEQHGYVLVKLRLDWQSLFHWSPWPGTNAAMRANLAADPHYQALFVLDLDDGSTPFATNVGHGGFGDGDYMPMGALPVVKHTAETGELAYVVMRGSPCKVEPCDGRWDSHLGEMLLDDSTVAGYAAGDVRFLDNTFFPTDEQPYLSMSGDVLLGAHWAFGLAHRIVDRSPARGSGADPVTTEDLPHVTVADDHAPFTPTHWYGDYLCAEGCGRTFPPGFFLYHTSAPVYDRYWSEYASWVVSGDSIYFVSTDGAVAAFEHGDPEAPMPLAGAGSAATPRSAALVTEATGVCSDDRGIDALVATAHASSSPEACGIDPASQAPVVGIDDVARHEGREVVVEGTLARVFDNGKATYLTFREPHQGTFLVRILREHLGAFNEPPSATWKAGMSVRVRGVVTWYQGGPTIYVTKAAQLAPISGARAGGTAPDANAS